MQTNENNMKNTRYGTAGIIREVRWGNMDTGCFTTLIFFSSKFKMPEVDSWFMGQYISINRN